MKNPETVAGLSCTQLNPLHLDVEPGILLLQYSVEV